MLAGPVFNLPVPDGRSYDVGNIFQNEELRLYLSDQSKVLVNQVAAWVRQRRALSTSLVLCVNGPGTLRLAVQDSPSVRDL